MGVRGEVFSSRVILPNRTYFFNVKENRMGDLYLNIVESKNRETGGFDRQSVILFADDLQEFLKGFDESLRVLEKSVRDKKRGGDKSGRGEMRDEKRDDTHGDAPPPRRVEKKGYGERTGRAERTERGERAGYGGGRDRYKHSGEKSERGGARSDRGAKDRYGRAGEKSGRPDRSPNRRSERGSDRGKSDRGAKGSKRVVVKKQER